jgi:hypothetical protein
MLYSIDRNSIGHDVTTQCRLNRVTISSIALKKIGRLSFSEACKKSLRFSLRGKGRCETRVAHGKFFNIVCEPIV